MPARLTRKNLLAYGLPGLPLAALGLPLVVYLPPFYAERLAAGTASVGLMLLLARLSDVLSDPLIGWASDRVGTPFGRRRPWVALGVPLLLLGTWFLFRPPAAAGLAYLLAWSVLAYLGWTVIYLPYLAWGAELSGDYDERSRITASREGFFALGTLVAILLPGWVQYSGGGAGDALRAVLYFLVAALPLAALVLLWRVPERPQIRVRSVRWREGVRVLAENRPFRRLLGAYLMNGMANGLPAALFLFFVDHVLEARALGGLFLGVYFLSGVITLPLWLRFSRRVSKHRIWCASMAWASLVFLFVPWLGAGDVIGFLIVCVASGASLGVDQALPASMQADVVDADTAASGAERTGLYFGLWGMATKLAFALATGVAYPILEWAGFSARGGNQGQALLALSLLYGGLPILIKLGVIPFVWNFPIDRDAQGELRRRIDAGAV